MSAELKIVDGVLEGLKNIGNGVVKIPGNVLSIKDFAFEDCSDLKEVDMADATSLTDIGKFAFYNCKNLKTITFGGKIRQIERSAFQNCTSLTNVKMLYGISRIEGWTFAGCTALKSLVIPNSVKEICSQAFAHCYHLNEIVSYSNEIHLNNDAFLHVDVQNCTINVPLFCDSKYKENEVWNKFRMTVQDVYSYEGILYKENPNSEEKNTLWVAENNSVNGEVIIAASVPIGDKHYGVVGIADNAFENNKYLESVTIPASVTHIGENVFVGCDKIKKFKVVNISSSHYDVVSDTLWDKDMTTLIAYPPACEERFILEIPDSVITLKAGSFSGMKYLKRIRFSSVISDKKMLSAAFEGIEKTVKKNCTIFIPENASSMQACLKSLDFNVEMGDYINKTFSCDGFDYKIIRENNLAATGVVELMRMTNGNNSTQITIPETTAYNAFKYNVSKISVEAFKDKTGITSVKFLGDKLEEIGKYAFSGCTNLTKIDGIPSSVNMIGDGVFNKCEKLTAISSSSGKYKLIDSLLFVDINKKKLLHYLISNKQEHYKLSSSFVTNIGESAFAKSALKSIELFDIDSIAAKAFSGCSALKLIECRASNIAPMIDENSFSETDLSYILVNNKTDFCSSENGKLWKSIFGNKIVESLPDFVCDNIKYHILTNDPSNRTAEISKSLSSVQCDIIIPGVAMNFGLEYKVVQIADTAFSFMEKIGKVEIKGSNLKSIGKGAFQYSSITSINIPASIETIGKEAFYSCKKLGIIDMNSAKIKQITDSTFKNCENLTSVSIPATVTSIGPEAFCSCKALNKISIPVSVESIGMRAFDSCTSASSLNFVSTSKVRSIGQYAFSGCSKLDNIVIPSSVEQIEESAFSGCEGLCTVTVNASVIGDSAFIGCYNLTNIKMGGVTTIEKSAFFRCGEKSTAKWTVNIPSSVSTIGENAFNMCSMSQVVFPANSSLQIIGDGAFADCTKLESISIPSKVASIGRGAFDLCKSLRSITLPSSVNTIGDAAFSRCLNLTIVINCKNFIMENNALIDVSKSGIRKLNSYIYMGQEGEGKYGTIDYRNDNITDISDSAFYVCPYLKSVTLSGVKTIGQYSFYRNTYLTNIKLGSKVTSIGESAFNSCVKVDAFYCNAKTPPRIETFTLSDMRGKIYVPIGCVQAYQNDSMWGKRVIYEQK